MLATLLVAATVSAQDKTYHSVKSTRTGVETIYGLVSPLDQDGRNFYLQNEDGLVEIKLTEKAEVGLMFRENKNLDLLEDRKVVLSQVGKREIPLPENLWVKVYFKDWKSAQNAVESGQFRDGMLSAKPLPDHLPTESELWLSGPLTGLEKAHITPTKVVTIDGKEYRGSTSGHNYAEQVAGLWDASAIQPFINQASAYGKMVNDVFLADYVFLRPIPDQAAQDDPALPRYLFIGDSISGNYGAGLHGAVDASMNVHHPPTNCGPSGKGRSLAGAWLGDYQTKGKHWDVISFNFGHWDAGNTKAEYQSNLEAVIDQLKPTGARLIWVTTCPVPNGYEEAGPLDSEGKAPGRTAGVMEKYLNPWAAEVMGRHPEITVCDQWQFVKNNEGGLYTDWWTGKNVHFNGEPADALGKFLAEAVLSVRKNEKPGAVAASDIVPASPGATSASATRVSGSSRRTFTNTSGKQIEAEVVNVTGDQVVLRRNEKDYPVPMASLSAADQEYLKQWSKPTPAVKPPAQKSDPVKEATPGTEGPIQLGKKIKRTDEEALKHLDPKWHEVQPLPETFPADYKLPLTGIADSGEEEVYDFNQPISPDVLARLQSKGKEAMVHKFYFAPRDPRYKEGPGLSGREYLEDAKKGTVREDLGHVAWIYGELKLNMMADYWLYRITKDSWFLEDIMAFADANQTLLEQNSKLFLSSGQRDTGTFNHQTDTQIQHVHAHFISARLLMERVMANRGGASDPDYLKAKQYFDFAWGLVGEPIMGPAPETYGKARGDKPAPTFTPGPSYNYILEKFDIPGFLAFKIEYEPWNGSGSRYLPLVHAALAAENLHRVSGDARYLTLSQTFERFVRAYLHMFQKGNHCVIDGEGQPYLWVYHTPGRDTGNRENPQLGFFRGHPLFGAEDNGHSGAMARNLPYVFEAGPRFGCSPALIAAYANSMADVLHNPNSRKNGKVHFHSHIDSPWMQAKVRPHGYAGKHPGTLYVECLAFSPDLLSGIRSWKGKDQNYDLPKANQFDLQVEVSRYLYQEWKKREG